MLVQGYHPGLEDDAFYLAAIKQNLNPSLFPHDADFFRVQFQATVFDKLIAFSLRWTHVPLEWGILFWQWGCDPSDSVGMLANQPAVFRRNARAVGGSDTGGSPADPSGLGHRAESDGPAPAPAGVGHGADFGCDRGRARQAVAAGGRAAGSGIFRARDHGGLRRVVLLVSAVEAGGADEDGPQRRSVWRAAVAPGMDFRSALGCVAAGGGHALVLFCVALALVRVARSGSAAAVAVVVPGAGRAPQPDGPGACGGAPGVLWRVPVGGGANHLAARPAGAFAPARADALSASCVSCCLCCWRGDCWGSTC